MPWMVWLFVVLLFALRVQQVHLGSNYNYSIAGGLNLLMIYTYGKSCLSEHCCSTLLTFIKEQWFLLLSSCKPFVHIHYFTFLWESCSDMLARFFGNVCYIFKCFAYFVNYTNWLCSLINSWLQPSDNIQFKCSKWRLHDTFLIVLFWMEWSNDWQQLILNTVKLVYNQR